ncbi:MAG: hypothetical protein HZR80_00850 [Candidatus Heimdallarchaeota archaeon]
MTKIKCPSRNLPDSGIPFIGVREIKIPSRIRLFKKIKEFIDIAYDSKTTTIRSIIGEWGEGKSQTYNYYIEPEVKKRKGISILVTASTISNSYTMKNIKKLQESTSLASLKFLIALFNALIEETKHKTQLFKFDEDKIAKISNPNEFVYDILKQLCSNKEKVIIFIDEFEELIFSDEIKDIISGVKEIINGQYKEIHEDGDFEGKLHLILGCTPDAFNHLMQDSDLSMIFGGLKRRTGTIKLPYLLKSEGINYINDLLKYCYNNELPEIHPFSSLGIANTLYRVCQGNLGNIVSIISRILKKAQINEKESILIDGEYLLDFLSNEYVTLFGSEVSCLDNSMYNRILSSLKVKETKLSEASIRIFKLLLGELIPLSADEISRRLSIDISTVKKAINLIDQEIQKFINVEKSILRLNPLKESLTKVNTEVLFAEFIKESEIERSIEFDNFKEAIDLFNDKIDHFYLINNEIKKIQHLPNFLNEAYIKVFFEGISSSITEIQNIIKSQSNTDITRYQICEQILDQLFPTPLPRGLEFIKDKRLRIDLWRNVLSNLQGEFLDKMPQAIAHIMHNSDMFSLDNVLDTKRVLKSTSRILYRKIGYKEIKRKENDYPINTLFFSIFGEVKSDDIDRIDRMIKEAPYTIHLVFLFYLGEINPSARKKIDEKGYGESGYNKILDISLHPTLCKKLLVINNAYYGYEDKIDEVRYFTSIGRILYDELDLKKRLVNWIEKQKIKGFIIYDFLLDKANTENLINTLKFYINMMDSPLSYEDVYKNNQGILKFQKYGSKSIGLAADIETLDEFKKISNDLLYNNFISRTKNDYIVKMHPIENRIIEFLKKKNHTGKTLHENFIDIAKSGNIFDKVFLRILEYKGRITQDRNNNITLRNKTEFCNLASEKVEDFQMFYAQKFDSYGHFLVSKQRDYRLVRIDEFKNFIEMLEQRINEIRYDEDKDNEMFQKCNLISNLLDEFYRKMKENISNAKNEGTSKATEMISKHQELERKLEIISKGCYELFKIKFDIDVIGDLNNIKKIVDEITSINESPTLTIDQISRVEKWKQEKSKILLKFKFDMKDDEAFYYNLTFFDICQNEDKFMELYEKNSGILEEIQVNLDSTKKKYEKLQSQLLTKDFDKELIITNFILDQIKLNPFENIKDVSLKSATLQSISKAVKENKDQFDNEITKSLNSIDELNKIFNLKNQFQSTLEDSEELLLKVKSLFDTNDSKEYIAQLDREIKTANEIYKKNFGVNSELELDKLIKKMDRSIFKYNENLSDQIEIIHKFWSDFIEEKNRFLNRRASLVKKFGDVNDSELSNMIRAVKSSITKIEKNYIVEDILKVKESIFKIENEFKKLRDKIQEIAKNVLKGKEFLLLTIILDIYEEGQWITLSDLTNNKDFKNSELSQKQTLQFLIKLIEKGFLDIGIKWD